VKSITSKYENLFFTYNVTLSADESVIALGAATDINEEHFGHVRLFRISTNNNTWEEEFINGKGIGRLQWILWDKIHPKPFS